MKRGLLAILAALILPACGHDDDDDDNRVTVTNVGDESVRVEIAHERENWAGGGSEHHDAYELPPGGQRTDVYPWTHRVKVGVVRRSDGLLIFAESYDPDDFDRHDQRIWIAVNP